MPWRVWQRNDFAAGWRPGPWFTVTDVAGVTFRLHPAVRRCQVFPAFPVSGCFTVLIVCAGDSLSAEEAIAHTLQESMYEPWCPAPVCVLVRSRRAAIAKLDEREAFHVEPDGQMELG